MNIEPEVLSGLLSAILARHDELHPPPGPSTLESVAESAGRCERMPEYARAYLGWAAGTLKEWGEKAEDMDRAVAMMEDMREIAGIAGGWAGPGTQGRTRP